MITLVRKGMIYLKCRKELAIRFHYRWYTFYNTPEYIANFEILRLHNTFRLKSGKSDIPINSDTSRRDDRSTECIIVQIRNGASKIVYTLFSRWAMALVPISI